MTNDELRTTNYKLRNNSSFVTRHSSFVTRHSSLVTRHSSLVIRHSSLVTRHSSFVTRHSSFVTRHSSLVIRHSSFVTRHSSFVILLLLSFLLSACVFPGSTQPVIKIGIIAPFDGQLRHQGYQRLYGVKLALQEVNLSGGVAGYKIELIALNDFANKDETILQAQELVLDSDVRGVVGQWDSALLNAAAPIYSAALLGVVKPAQFTDDAGLPGTFAADFESLSGSSPNVEAQQAYLATYRLLKAIEKAVAEAGRPERAVIFETLITSTR